MPTRFVCLANSLKEGGRCLAGIELDNSNNPKVENGHPKWIRPICKSLHGEIFTPFVAHLNLLDVVEIDVTGYPEKKSYQSENAFFNVNTIRVAGRFSDDNLNRLCDNRSIIFGNRGKAVSAEAITNLNYSLMLIKTNQFQVIKRTYNDNQAKLQLRLAFSYNGNRYDFPVTDPLFLHYYQTNPDFINSSNEAYLCLSVGIAWQDWHYKLVAAVIFMD